MEFIIEIVSFTCTSAKIRYQLKNFLGDVDLEDKPNGITFCCLVKCLSTGSV
jgi:hypothetical protein